MESVLAYMDKGGVFIYPILLGSIWAFTLIIERMIFIRRFAFRIRRQADHFLRVLQSKGPTGAAGILANWAGIQKEVLAAVVINPLDSREKTNNRVETRLLENLPELSRFLNTIATLGTLMPILGLLGTVTGMIATFHTIALVGSGNPHALADGISEALITTQAGMVAAVPIMLCHNFLRNRYQRVAAKVRANASAAMEIMEERQHV